MASPKVTTEALREMKRRGEKIVALTAYDYLMGAILDDAGVDQFNLYLMSGDEEAQLEAYGSTIIPAFKAALADA